jgi:2-iminobutanoate/2-iminopropanoate deaminase
MQTKSTKKATSASASASGRHAIDFPGDSPSFPFSEGIVVGKQLYISGQEGRDKKGNLVKGGIGPETRAALKLLQEVVKLAKFKMSDLTLVTVFLSDINEFDAMNTIYAKHMPTPKPARATVQVAALYGGARVEISAIAVKT